MSVRSDQLVYRAGGAALARYGTLRKRTASFEEILETSARASTAAVFDRNGVLRLVETNAVRVSFLDLDGDGDRETLSVTVEGALVQLCEFNVPGGTPSDFELSPMGVTEMTAEDYVHIDEGDLLQFVAPAINDPNEFCVLVWGKPNWASGDGEGHRAIQISLDSSNLIYLDKTSSGALVLVHSGQGTGEVTALTPSWSAGDEVFFAGRMSAGTLTLYHDTNGDGTLNTDSQSTTDDALGGTYTAYIGGDASGATPFDGGLNIAILNIGSSADPITDRYNGGDGMDVQEWFDQVHPDSGLKYEDHLVAYLPYSSDGSEVLAKSNGAETYLLLPGGDGSAFARTANDAVFDVTDLDFAFYIAPEDWTPGVDNVVVSKWAAAGDQRSFQIKIKTTGEINYQWTTDGTNGTSTTQQSTVAITPPGSGGLWGRVKHDVDDGASGYTVDFETSTDGSSWTPLGTQKVGVVTTAIFYGTSNLDLGSNGTSDAFAGQFLAARWRDAIDGDLIYSPDFENLYAGIASFIEDSTEAHTVTINGTAQVRPAGNAPVVASLRNDTATQVSIDGVVDTVAANVLRNAHYEGGERGTLVEPAYENVMTEKDLDAWTKVGSPVVTAITGPDGVGGSAFTVEDDDGAAAESISERVYFTEAGLASVKIAVRENTMPGSGNQSLRIRDNSAAAWVGQMDVTSWASGEPQITETVGTLLDKWELGDTGWWVLAIQTTAITSANTNQWRIQPADTANQTGKIDVFFPGAFDAPYPPRSLLDASEVTTEDVFKKAYTSTPQASTHLLTIVDLDAGLDAASNLRIVQIGNNDGGSDAWLNIYSASTTQIGIQHDNGTGLVTSSVNIPTRSIGDVLRIRVTLFADGSIQGHVSVNGAAEVDGSVTAANTLAAGWADDVITLGGQGNDAGITSATVVGIISFKSNTGDISLAAMDALVTPDLYHYWPGQFDELDTTAWSVATKGAAVPKLSGLGGAVGIADASIVDWDSESPSSPDAFDAAFGGAGLQRVVKFDTGPSGTATRAYRLGVSGELNDLTAGDWYSMVVGVFIPTGSAITAANVKAYAFDDVGQTTGDTATAKGRWQWLYLQHQIDASATEAYFEIQVESGVSFGTANAYAYIALPTIVAGRVRPIPIPNDGEGTVSKAAGTIVESFVVPSSSAITWQLKFVENGEAYASSEGILSRIDDGSTDPGFRIFAGGAQRYRIEYDDGTTVAEVALSPSVTLGQMVEIRAVFVPSTGALTAGVSVNAGAETTGSDTGGIDPADWSGAYVRKGPSVGFDWLDEKIALGSHSLASMRAAE